MRSQRPLRVLTLSELFPTPNRPAFGIFVAHQVSHLQPYCEQTVVVPSRVFPPLRLVRQVANPSAFKEAWRAWRDDLATTPDSTERDGVTVYYPRYTSPPKQGFNGLWGFFAYPFLRGLLQRLHAEHSFDIVHAHYAIASGVVALLARRWMKVPVVLSIHGSDVTYTARQNGLSRAIIRWAFQGVDRLVANSSWTVRQIEHYGGAPDRIEIVRLGVNRNDGAAAQGAGQVPGDDGELHLLSVGYLEERKGHAYVLHALQRLHAEGRRVRYTIVGDGAQSQALEALASNLGIRSLVAFEGYLPQEAVWPHFAACDLFVLPSVDEAFGLVYIEALSQGKAVIGCVGEGGPEDLRALGDCIELVEPRDVDSLTDAIRRLMDDPARRRALGETGRQIVQAHFTWERTAAATHALYRRVLDDYRQGTHRRAVAPY